MYFAMDEIGFENMEEIMKISNESGKWRFIYDAARTYGFDGIHITPSLYKNFGVDYRNVPEYFRDFKLTLHLGGIHSVTSEKEYETLDEELETGFEIAAEYGMHDISIHPPYLIRLTQAEKDLSYEFFHKLVSKWVKTAVTSGISLSLETHVYGKAFLFGGYGEFANFVNNYPDLSVLIDISHNYYDPPYSEDEIIDFAGRNNIKGLHISDALRDKEYQESLHLAIGDGIIDFPRLLKGFEKFLDLYGVLEIKANNAGIQKSLNYLKGLCNGHHHI
ncbi:MAG: sugar phosphate isomerase/epimerase [Defluviitaleaceae bacterium]|nr:sugar phosphate isomerase/epimerase [Defluviitaleaceae bacterium]MCL2835371.1 sugar phosphate isomerase/epimerase [Defluviitaleaceae bacterium]